MGRCVRVQINVFGIEKSRLCGVACKPVAIGESLTPTSSTQAYLWKRTEECLDLLLLLLLFYSTNIFIPKLSSIFMEGAENHTTKVFSPQKAGCLLKCGDASCSLLAVVKLATRSVHPLLGDMPNSTGHLARRSPLQQSLADEATFMSFMLLSDHS